MAKTIWPKMAPGFVAKALSGHMAIGVAVSALLYILTISGTLLVFHQELERWEQPGAPEIAALSPDAAERAAQAIIDRQGQSTTHLYVGLPTAEFPRSVITTDHGAAFANSDGSLAGREHFPWTQFVLDMHYYLHIPGVLGLTIVGILGVMMVAMAMTGFLAHPRILKDAFSMRLGRGRLTQADLHNRLSVWTAPFHIAVSATGAILGLASIVAFGIALANFNGDTGKVFEPVFGSEPPPDESPAQLADVSAALGHFEAQGHNAIPTYVIVHDPQTAGQHIQIIAEHPDRVIFGEYYNYNAAGEFQSTTGMSDGAIGQQVSASLYQLHFGSFGGIPVKAIYVLLGLALAVIIASGMRIYFLKRAEKGRPAVRLDCAWTAIVWGMPAALGFAYLGNAAAGLEGGALTAIFWLSLMVFIIAAMVAARPDAVSRIARAGSGGLVILAALVHAVRHGGSFDAPAAFWVTAIFLLTGLALAVSASGSLRSRLSALPPRRAEESPRAN
ncbi:MAG: PepSY domain-containing protein [Euryhalocaulis sp.]|uniref:PepSY-associated TM helix domain-containing protein n=1 Tax=Euryhalocaulis sp. TaxID=2744307 RepID=UPI00184733F7|nr:PepSY-associated TM helix domain-containing protein [Euryhalocaulis sp.]MBA4801749.1 PepSY domain-containing protein [Euryhalocaulis sp.]